MHHDEILTHVFLFTLSIQSDLRVKHREETKVVSRLTMENMNLASRCRQAISEAADLKRKVVGYEKRHGDFGNLQKEVLLLRRQIERQHGSGSGSGGSGVEKSGSGGGGLDKSSNSRRNRSTSPKGGKRSGNHGSDGASSNANNTPVDEKKKRKAAAAAAATNGSSLTLETKNSTETTDLDRIMAKELFKNNGAAASASTAGSGGGEGGISDGSNASSGNAAEKKDGNTNAVMKKFQELNISTTAAAASSSSATANTKSGGGSKVTSSSTLANNAMSSSKRSNTTTTTSSGTDSTSNSNSNNISSANTKIPISVTTSSATQKDDDEFDAEIDMVGFFAKSSQTKLGASSSASANNSSSDSSGADGVPPSSKHSRSHITHKLKKTETDDHMPEELVGSADLLSPSNKSSSEKNVGDNLLSSLDAFEASFASAFPETSFSIKSEVPSTTQLDMSFDVPVFDPFFKSPVNKDREATSTSLHQSPPKSKSAMSGVSSGSGNSNSHKDGMKSQLKDLFPDSALTTSPKRGLDLTFDSTFPDVDIGGGSSSSNSNTNKSGKGKSSLSADKLDSAFSRAHATPTASTKTAGGSSAGGGGGKSSSSSNRPPPLDMSAEIEQLDALASANTEKAEGGENRKRSVRKVKTPLSYAEPSISQKLRRGDVLFPKIDADRKLELEAKRSKSGGAGTTDLDRIMSEHFSVSNNTNKKDGAAPS